MMEMNFFDEADVVAEMSDNSDTATMTTPTRSPRKRQYSDYDFSSINQLNLSQLLADDPMPGIDENSFSNFDEIEPVETVDVATPTKDSGKARSVCPELQSAISLLNPLLGADTDHIDNLYSCLVYSVSNSQSKTASPIGVSAREIYSDPIEKRIRLREYKVTEANPTPWKRDFAFPDFKAEVLTVVASVSLAVDLDLKRIAERARNIEYNPKRFASLIMRIREPKSAALIFSSGKMVVAGTKTEDECRRAVRKYARVIQRIGYRVSIVNFEIQNISASGHLRFGVRVHEMAQDEKIKRFVTYEAEIFPGLVYSLVKPKVKAIIFVTGAILMTGAKSEAEIQEALETIYPIARQHRR